MTPLCYADGYACANQVIDFYAQLGVPRELAARRRHYAQMNAAEYVGRAAVVNDYIRGGTGRDELFDNQGRGHFLYETPHPDDRPGLMHDAWQSAQLFLHNSAVNNQDALVYAGLIVAGAHFLVQPAADGNKRHGAMEAEIMIHGPTEAAVPQIQRSCTGNLRDYSAFIGMVKEPIYEISDRHMEQKHGLNKVVVDWPDNGMPQVVNNTLHRMRALDVMRDAVVYRLYVHNEIVRRAIDECVIIDMSVETEQTEHNALWPAILHGQRRGRAIINVAAIIEELTQGEDVVDDEQLDAAKRWASAEYVKAFYGAMCDDVPLAPGAYESLHEEYVRTSTSSRPTDKKRAEIIYNGINMYQGPDGMLPRDLCRIWHEALRV